MRYSFYLENWFHRFYRTGISKYVKYGCVVYSQRLLALFQVKLRLFPNIIFLLTMFFVFSAHAKCQKLNEVCVEGPGYRTFYNVPIYKPCWRYQINYQCQADSYKDDCSILRNNSGCTQTSSSCGEKDFANDCKIFKDGFTCGNLLEAKEGIVYLGQDDVILQDKIDENECLDLASQCHLGTKKCLAQSEIISYTKKEKICTIEQQDYQCLTEQLNDNCSKFSKDCKLQDRVCINNLANGNCANYERSYLCENNSKISNENLLCGEKIYCLDGNCTESKETLANGNMAKAISYLAMINGAAKELKNGDLTTFTGQSLSCSKAPFGFNNCCRDDGWGQDIGLADCNEKEKLLIHQIGAGMCHYVGSYCSKKTPFSICLEKTKSYCCFAGKLARIINEQAKTQLALNWGSPKNPDCRGLSIEQLQKLDFSKIDLSEIYPDFVAKVKVLDQNKLNQNLIKNIEDHYAR